MPTSLSAMLALFNDNTSGDISAADGRAIIQALYDWIPAVEKYKAGRLAGETAHAADDFFATYTGYTEQAPSGTATWAASRGGLTCKFTSVGSSFIAATLKAVPVAGVPITIETAITPMLLGGANPGGGLIFTNGTGAGATIAGFGVFDNGAGINLLGYPSGTLNSASTNATGSINNYGVSPLFLRAVWSAANTFEVAWSPDGETWTDFSLTTYSRTFTPTHMGFWVSNWNSSGVQASICFSYLRVYEADLSV